MEFETEKVTVSVDSKGVNIQKKSKKRLFVEMIVDTVIQPLCFGIAVILYVALSLALPEMKGPSGATPWEYLWTIFFLCPLITETIRAIVKRKLALFPVWAAVVFAYLFGGMYAGLWDPYWVMFFLIPGFYSIVVPIDRGIKEFHKYKEDSKNNDQI